MSGKKIAYWFAPVNAEVLPLLSLHTCSSGSPGYKNARITAGERDGLSPLLTNLSVPLFNDGVVVWFEIWKISAKFSSGKK